jgi:hypothetical protein
VLVGPPKLKGDDVVVPLSVDSPNVNGDGELELKRVDFDDDVPEPGEPKVNGVVCKGDELRLDEVVPADAELPKLKVVVCEEDEALAEVPKVACVELVVEPPKLNGAVFADEKAELDVKGELELKGGVFEAAGPELLPTVRLEKPNGPCVVDSSPFDGSETSLPSTISPQAATATCCNGACDFLFVFSFPSASTTSMPSTTSPKTTCFPSKFGTCFNVKNTWEELEFGPELAILSNPGFECWRKFSSLNFPHVSPLRANTSGVFK